MRKQKGLGIMAYCFGDYQKAAASILTATPTRPKTAVVLGSGLGAFAARLTGVCRIPYGQIPGFPVSTAPSHAGEMLLGRIEDCDICVMSGRFHYYEGWSPEAAAFYIGVLKLIGVRRLILTNAAGGISKELKPGSLMLIRDHINFSGLSPCRGENIDELGPRFFDLSDAYSASLRQVARDCAAKAGIVVSEGVYAYMTGPQYETPAEIRALKILGADAVGMSTVPEAIEAAHCGLQTLGISVITNYAAGISGAPISGGDVTDVAATVGEIFGGYLALLIKSLNMGKMIADK